MPSLQVRIPLLATAILAVSLGVAAALAFELLLITGRNELEQVLRREQHRFQRSLPRMIEEVREEASHPPDTATLRLAVERYFQLNSGTDAYLTIVRIGDDVLRAEEGPAALGRVEDRGQLPVGRSSGLETLDTSEGEILSLTTELAVADPAPATLQVAAPLSPVRAGAVQALTRLGIASLVSLALGGTVLALVLRRALRPLHALASMAREAELEDLSLRVPEPKTTDEVGILARELNRMLERLERAMAGQREFMATVSHELRTPVTIARGHIEVLESLGAESAEDRRQIVSLVRDELLRTQRLVEDLMTLARSKAEDFVIKKPMALSDFFEDLGLRVSGLGIGEVTLHPPPDTTIEADAERLAQAALNLILNAAVHTEPGTRIEVGARNRGEFVEVFVRDDGLGIAPSLLPAIFEPFVKGETKAGRRSSGLGLAVVAAVVRAHEGTIDVGTGTGGTTITLRLPVDARSLKQFPATDLNGPAEPS